MEQRVLTVIPAKGTSTRITRKNMRDLGGRPLMDYTVEAALTSGVCGRVIVSTEDDEIAAHAREVGAEVPFMRPRELSFDPYQSPDIAVHALEMLEAQGAAFDIVMLLQPTSPFRNAHDLRAAMRLFEEEAEPRLMSVHAADPHVRLVMRSEANRLHHLFDPEEQESSDALYMPDGAIQMARVAEFKRTRSFYGAPLIGYVLPHPRGIDIDTGEELAMAKYLLEHHEELVKTYGNTR